MVLWDGEFGRATAAALVASEGVRQGRLDDALLANPGSMLDAGLGFTVFVANRPLRRRLLQLDEFLWRSGIEWMCCELNDTRLVLGPVIVPGASPCFRCCSARYRSLSFGKRELEDETAFEDHLAANGKVEVGGFTPAMVALAAEYIRTIPLRGASAAGLMREVELPELTIRQGRAVPLHGCALCGPPVAAPADRFVRDLKQMLEAADGRH